jgi:hypothetical protein
VSIDRLYSSPLSHLTIFRENPTLPAIPVEIWHAILLEVIQPPFVLDTTVPIEGNYWHRQGWYHNTESYREAESHREKIRDVCRSWRAFADSHQFRWITYNSGGNHNPQDQKEAEKALEIETPHPEEQIEAIRTVNTPQRMMMFITKNEDMRIFRRTIDYFSIKLTTLFVNCSDKYGTPIFEHLVARSALLSTLRCLMLRSVDLSLAPLRTISTHFPLLTGLTLERGKPPHDSSDFLDLGQLESLYLDFRTLIGMSPENWKVPELVRLSIPLSNDHDEKEIFSQFMKAHGRNLVFLHLNYVSNILLPHSLWTWCPSLTEIVTSFVEVAFQSPIPTQHPLKYIVHFPHLSMMTGLIDPPMEETTLPTIIRNIYLLPPHVRAFTVAITSWADYLDDPDASSHMHLWKAVQRACTDRDIRLEDEEGKTIDEYPISTTTEGEE